MEEGELSSCPQHPDETLIKNDRGEWTCDVCQSKSEGIEIRDKKSSKKDKKHRSRSRKRDKEKKRSRSRSKKRDRSRSKKRDRSRSKKKDRSRSRKRDRSKSKKKDRSRSKKRDRSRSHKRDRHRSRSQRRHDDRSSSKINDRDGNRPLKRNDDRSTRRHDDRNRSRSPRRHDDRNRSRSPRRHDDRNKSRSPRRHDDRNRSRSPRRHDDRNRSRSPRRHDNRSLIKYDGVFDDRREENRNSKSLRNGDRGDPNNKRPYPNSEKEDDSKKIRLSDNPVEKKEVGIKEHHASDNEKVGECQIKSEEAIIVEEDDDDEEEKEKARLERRRIEKQELQLKIQKLKEIEAQNPQDTVQEEIVEPDNQNTEIATENIEKDNCKAITENKKNMFDIFSDIDHAIELLDPKQSMIIDRTNDSLQTDGDGYYVPRIGEILDKRYNVYGISGRGVFSIVVRVRDRTENNKEAVIKILRNNDVMLSAGLNEVKIMNKLNEKDPEDKYHCLRMYRTFYHSKHLSIVFEPLYINLREVIQKFGKDQGLAIKGVRIYAQQMFMALKHLQKCEILHADIKPDNILVDESKAKLKLCDFGCASELNKNDGAVSYMVSRYYRAPEIILGIPIDYSIDLWSVAVTIYELHTGRIMFEGKSNNEMLKLFMEYKGKFSHKLIKRGVFKDKHFDQNFNFLYQEFDKVTQKEKVTVIRMKDATKNLLKDFTASNEKVHGEDYRAVKNLSELLDKSLELDPLKRLKLHEIMTHAFLR